MKIITLISDLLSANTNYNDSITESTLYNFSELGTTVEIRRNRFWREWRRGDPSVNKSMWNSKAPLGEYIGIRRRKIGLKMAKYKILLNIKTTHSCSSLRDVRM